MDLRDIEIGGVEYDALMAVVNAVNEKVVPNRAMWLAALGVAEDDWEEYYDDLLFREGPDGETVIFLLEAMEQAGTHPALQGIDILDFAMLLRSESGARLAAG